MISINGLPIPTTIFPDKTSQVWKLPEQFLSLGCVRIDWVFSNEAEIIHLAQLRDLLRAYGNPVVKLHMDYLPYGRQDKRIHNNSTFALRSFAKIINDMSFDSVSCIDPHSNEAQDLIRNLEAIYPTVAMLDVFKKTGADLVCYPDQGAHSKYASMLPELPCIFGEKVRDQLSGDIVELEFIGSVKNKRVLIVDDICDGGATFVRLAQKLYDQKAREVNLYVSHGLFSKGIDVLRAAKIKRIFTKDGEIK